MSRGRFLSIREAAAESGSQWPLVILAALGTLPVVLPCVLAYPALGTGEQGFKGYWCSHWMIFPFALPMSLAVARWLIRKTCGDVSVREPNSPLSSLIGDVRGCAPISACIRQIALGWTTLIVALVLAAIINILDVREVGAIYSKYLLSANIDEMTFASENPPREEDWSVVFLAKSPTREVYAKRISLLTLRLISISSCSFLWHFGF